MKQWWQSKTQQEHLAMIIGGTAVLLLLIYLIVWRPFQQSLEQKALLVKSQESTLQWMKDNADLVKNIRNDQPGKGAASNEALLTLVDRTAKRIQLRQQIKRIKPQGDDSVQLWVEEASFDTLIRWLGEMTQEYALNIESLNIDRQDAPGLINARVVLQRGG
ncbi:MAG: type II secretion system protein M [Candidatus Thiodiazotropha lotti]|uniref:Type II secretion system protein M n=1 Tax=Candidatus Thiodiazotropha endoloripes TaxID=1818881 RepID=A0A1E2UU40_9GAMM|nr:type II secretion system protein M [Candidatus Thiodiazotropha endoloripes]MCG7897349.1 type II secretion system protein M [Candidatus Thiodiazotropha weberae]MCG7991034.1 type II secretion system protein M [Candidatus Thiodiazotropha lotti]MCG7902744.1 type II secretion system protein M [Candidatus Thiodiazotropha weberae]MCG7914726.1 type II secretion system protein M [Candidatus Thiodiazotropha weberae]MCG8000983.1 type II secretion system protein M [Candidatus Thiodiazotropha lotti]